MTERLTTITKTHGHLFGAIGGGAMGFNQANARLGNIEARMRCLGSVDVDAAACRAFERNVGVKATCLDLFDLEQYVAWNGHEPPPGWRPAMPEDIQRAMQWERPDLGFLSAPCKGFSGLLPESSSKLPRYEALNRLTVRGVWLWLEAFKHDPTPIIFFENVPRIMVRGRALLDQIAGLFRAYGYAWAETTHDCGEIGNLGQSRKRFLGVARHMEKVPPFLYQPPKRRLRGVGEILDLLPLPGDVENGGPMHRVPALHWKTWVRLAFVEPGKDWRSLNSLAVQDGYLRDFAIAPEVTWRDGTLGVIGEDSHSGVVTAQAEATTGRFSIADLKTVNAMEGSGHLGVRRWEDFSGVISGDARPSKGAYAVGDPRVDGHPKSVQLGVRKWEKPAAVVKGDVSVGTGPYAVADPGYRGRTPFNHVFRIVPWGVEAPAVHGPGGPGGMAVADPSGQTNRHVNGKYRITPYDGPANAVIAASTTGNGATAVADPRTTHGPGAHSNKHRVVAYEGAAPTVATSDRVGSGALSVADPRTPGRRNGALGVVRRDEASGVVAGESLPPNGAFAVADDIRPACLNRDDREGYSTQGHYGVLGWEHSSGAVPAFAKNNNGSWSVADGRVDAILPGLNDQLVCVIIARDGTWHRPFTTLDLAALQSLVDPENPLGFYLEGKSDSAFREWIGNAVPPKAARAMGEVGLYTLLLADAGESFMLSSTPVWVQPLAVALSVDLAGQVPA